jgi:hypothetical protein
LARGKAWRAGIRPEGSRGQGDGRIERRVGSLGATQRVHGARQRKRSRSGAAKELDTVTQGERSREEARAGAARSVERNPSQRAQPPWEGARREVRRRGSRRRTGGRASSKPAMGRRGEGAWTGKSRGASSGRDGGRRRAHGCNFARAGELGWANAPGSFGPRQGRICVRGCLGCSPGRSPATANRRSTVHQVMQSSSRQPVTTCLRLPSSRQPPLASRRLTPGGRRPEHRRGLAAPRALPPGPGLLAGSRHSPRAVSRPEAGAPPRARGAAGAPSRSWAPGRLASIREAKQASSEGEASWQAVEP